ncbi:NfeD family protein [Cuniculiplasma sp. SKW4]|uniref:hypothetical protein n=1 Tax=Cuniculiplasma sp. SKW4 TaxID=3400171 RepID=UPI003FD5B30C
MNNTTAYLLFVLIAIVFFFLGAWFYRFVLWYPRGRKSVTGAKSLVGKDATVVRDNGTVLVVRVDGVNWNAKYNGTNRPQVGSVLKIKDVSGLYLILEENSSGN